MNTLWNKKHQEALLNLYPPAKPSEYEINQYKNEIKSLKRKLNRDLDVLILGTTKELIDLAIEEKLNITIIDSSEEYCKELLSKYIYIYTNN